VIVTQRGYTAMILVCAKAGETNVETYRGLSVVSGGGHCPERLGTVLY